MKSFAAVFIALCAAMSTAQEAPEITRADLAVSLLRFELAMQNANLDGQRLANVNRAFDTATLAFFQQQFGSALSQIDALAIDLMPNIDPDAARRAAAMRVALEPPVFNRADGAHPVIRCTTLYPPGPAGTVIDAAIAILGPDGAVIGGARPRVETAGAAGDTVTIADAVDFAALAPGRYEFVLVPGGVHDAGEPGKRLVSGAFLVTEQSLDSVRDANASRIAALHPETPALQQAATAVAARNGLLTDSPDPSNTAQLMLDLTAVAREIDAEINAIASGTNPYAGRTGDYWTTVKSPSRDFPARVYVPASADLSEPLPVLIAFHGAGGDENMFMDAYGAGAIKQAAEKHGLLLVTPLTYAFATNPGEQVDALIGALEDLYAIDADRIYTLGHSMGGGTVAGVLNARADRFAAAAALCGFRGLTAEAIPPTLVLAAELDPIVSPSRIEPFVNMAVEKDLPVEYRLISNYGHTAIVGDYIGEVVDWLVEHAAH